MMQQVELVLRQFLVADAETAQWPKACVDSINRARLRGEGLHQFPAAANQGTRFRGQFAGRLQRSDLPNFLKGERVSVQLNHAEKRRAELLDHSLSTGKCVVQRMVSEIGQ